MPAHAIMLQLPESLYEHVKQRAKHARRTLEAEIVRIVAAAVPTDDALPAALEAEIESLETLPDEALQECAQARLSAAESARLESLHLQQQDTALKAGEKTELAELLGRYERAIVIRAQAIRLLADRGHDVSAFLGR